MNNKAIVKKMKDKIALKKAVFGTTSSLGILVKTAAEVSLDFTVVHKESLFGIDGRLPLLARIGYGGNCNEIILDKSTDILRFSGDMPVVAGVGVAEPYHNVDRMAEMMLEKGYSGLTHIPSSGGWIGDFGNSISKAGCGYPAEVEFISRWSKRDVFTVGYCFEDEQVKMMGDAGAGLIAIYVHKTVDESHGWANASSEDEAVYKAAAMVEMARKANPQAIVLVASGDVRNSEDAQKLILNTKSDGYLGDEMLETSLVYRAVSGSIDHTRKMCGREGGK